METNSFKKMIVFQLADEEYAVPVGQVGSIERLMPITRVPQTADFVKGVINLRGVVIPIIDLRLRFNMGENESSEESRIIITQIDEWEVGLVVDSANDVIDLSLDQIEPPPEVIQSVNEEYIEGVAKLDERLFILLNLEKVLETSEIVKIQGLADA